jgi:hypothetical protein
VGLKTPRLKNILLRNVKRASDLGGFFGRTTQTKGDGHGDQWRALMNTIINLRLL